VISPTGLPQQLTDVRRCLVMGILNVTPDSFSDGGHYLDVEAAVAHGLQLLRDGADIVDVGGESTRPGAQRVPAAEERRRVLPVVRALVCAGAVVSIDTMRAETARAALDEGAAIVNDVSGGLADADMSSVVASAAVPFVVMHWRGHSIDMQERATYDDVVQEVGRELQQRVATLERAGVDRRQVILDPGLGFAKEAEHNWALLARLDALLALGHPVLVGSSRKRFLEDVVAGPARNSSDAARRDDATAAVSALVAAAGAWGVRVHEVAATRAAVHVAAAVRSAATTRGGS
jgi:dihydropteroate synthase